MTTASGLNELLLTVTAAVVDGAEALAVNVTGAGRPVNVAVTVCGDVEPRLSAVVATPLALVVPCAGETAPPPDATAQLTTTPGTAQPLASRAVTLKGDGSGLLKYHGPGSPLVFTSCVAAPGMHGPIPPPPPPPHASPSNPAPSAGSRPQRKNVIAPLRLSVMV
jgi:hypothetical protein